MCIYIYIYIFQNTVLTAFHLSKINPNKAGLFEGSFSGEANLTSFIFQEELISNQFKSI